MQDIRISEDQEQTFRISESELRKAEMQTRISEDQRAEYQNSRISGADCRSVIWYPDVLVSSLLISGSSDAQQARAYGVKREWNCELRKTLGSKSGY
jgi:hypothetical protein